MKRIFVLTGAIALFAAMAGCGQAPQSPEAAGTAVSVAAANTNGRGGAMPAFYDGQLFTINLKELPTNAETSQIAHNGSINTIYECDTCTHFTAVIDAIQGDGFNPLWREVQIVPTDPNVQFTSDDQIDAAAAAGTITLVPTDEVYRCSVIGPKKH
jgi:hypothetical protein